MKVETLVLRVPVASKGLQDKVAKLARGVVLEPTVPVGCLESRAPRVTEALMDFLVCLVKRDTGASQGQWDPRVPLERMDREARMERSGPEDWLARAVLEVCSGLVVLRDPLDHPVLLELTDLQVPKETWDHKESQAHPVNKESLEHRVFLVPKAPLDHLEKKDLRADLGYLDYLELMGPLVILVRRVHLERKEDKVHQVHRVLLVILALVVSRVRMASVVSRDQREKRVRMVSQVSRGTWESKETGVSLACLGPVERMVLRVLKVELAPTESQVP